MIKKTVQVGNPVIRKKSKKVKDIFSKNTQNHIRDLIDSMRDHELVGMASPQVGENLNIFVTEIRKTKFRDAKLLDPLRVFINPKIIELSKMEVSGFEGCGSVAEAGIFAKVPRSKSVTIEAFDKKGVKFELTAKKLLARVILHEMDHLNGVVFLDKIKDTKSLMSKSEYVK